MMLADFPQHLLDGLAKKPAPPAVAPLPPISLSAKSDRVAAYVATWPGVPEGQRNPEAERHAACLTHDFALSEEEAWPHLCGWNAKNAPALTEEELRDCLRNGLRYGTHPPGEKLTALPFAVVVAPGQARPPAEGTPTTAFAHTDAGRAELFCHRHSNVVRFCRERGGWWRYDGRHWTTKDGVDACRQFAIQDARQMLLDANQIEDDEKRRDTVEYALRCESAARIQAMLSLAESMPHLMVAADRFDADIYLLNSPNGTVDLRTGVLRLHDPRDMLTKLTGAEYDPRAELPLWPDHLRKIFHGDGQLIEFLQDALGYSATGDTREEKLFLVHGPTAGGKTTTMEGAKVALGDYAVTCDFETFLKRPIGGIRNDLARLAGGRMIVSVEVDEGQTLAEGLAKQWTGGDKVTARFLHAEHFEFRPQGKLWLVCNDAPKARDTDDALWRRIVRVPFEHSIPKSERDPDIKRLLTDPTVGGPAILAWIVAGCERWRKTGLVIPSVVETATEALREAQDPLRDFFDDCCEFAAEAYVPVQALRKAYDTYAQEQGIRFPLGPQSFNRQLEAKGCERRTRRCVNDLGTERVVKCWTGVSLQEQAQELRQKEWLQK